MMRLGSLYFLLRNFFPIVIIVLLSGNLLGQSLNRPKYKGKFKYTVSGAGNAHYTLLNKNLTYDNGICGFLKNILYPLSSDLKKGFRQINGGFYIQNCKFIQNPNTVTDVLQTCDDITLQIERKSEGYILENAFYQPLVISGLAGSLVVTGNKIPYFYYKGSRSGGLHLDNNTINQVVDISELYNDRIQILNNNFVKDSAIIHVVKSKITDLTISSNKTKSLSMKFIADTLGDVQSLGQIMSEAGVAENSHEMSFYKSILGKIYFDNKESNKIQKLAFDNCEFKGEATIGLSNVDTLEIIDCNNFEKKVRLYNSSPQHLTVLKLSNSDLNEVSFDYDRGFALYQWPDKYKTTAVYEQLLAKFSAEKKIRSYELIDIEYFKFKNNALVNGLAYIWWKYSYNKWLIVIWTLFFLLVFSVINFFVWDVICDTYVINHSEQITQTPDRVSKFIKIFVFTAIVFFSLRVDFEKLSFKKTLALAYFFLIYTTGLLCLFFFVNFILKL